MRLKSGSSVVIAVVIIIGLICFFPSRDPHPSASIASDVERVSFVQPPSKLRPCLLSDDQAEFVHLAHICTDKTTTHQYDNLYARVLYRYRHMDYDDLARSDRKYSLLEMGVGCTGMPCSAGGFRLFHKYVPQVAYHGMDPYFSNCFVGAHAAHLRAVDGTYLMLHACNSSNQEIVALQDCSRRFGPFEVIVDDASHKQSDIGNSYDLLFNSRMLNPGGFYVIEDLETSFVETKLYNGFAKDQRANRTIALYVRNMIACWVLGDCYGFPEVTNRNKDIIDTIGVFHESVYLRKAFNDQHTLPASYIAETPRCLHDVMHGLTEGPDRSDHLRIPGAVMILDFYGACGDASSPAYTLCQNKVLRLFPSHRITSFEQIASDATSGAYQHDAKATMIHSIMQHAAYHNGVYAVLTFSAVGNSKTQSKVIAHIAAMLQSNFFLRGGVIAIVGLKIEGRGGPVLTFLYDILFMMLSYSPSQLASKNTQRVYPPKYPIVGTLVKEIGEMTFVSNGEIAFISKVPLRVK